jgi:hypothetical protein
MERREVDPRERVTDWIARYEAAWREPGTASLPDLFTPDATYRTAPFEEPYVGVAAIGLLWEKGRESHEERFDLSAEIVAIEGSIAVARVDVAYTDPPEGAYRNLWVLELDDDGRCRSFEEWPFAPDASGWFERGPTPSRRTHRAGLELGRAKTAAAVEQRARRA